MKTLAYLILTFTVAYCCGNLNGSIIASTWLHHSDVRDQGSGNAGLTNFYRCYGPGTALLVVLIDIVKAVAAVFAGEIMMKSCGLPELGQGVAMLGAMIGHIYPAAYQFRGGKGVLTAFSALMVIDWRVGTVLLAVFILIVALTRYVSLGSVISSALMPVGLFLDLHSLPITLLSALCAALIIYMHRSNIRRLRDGTESKFSFRRRKEQE